MKALKHKEVKEILIKNWMTHDALWFFNCVQECGIEKTNKINKAAVRSMGTIEIQRIKKAVGVERPETFEDFKSMIDATWGVVKGDFMKFSCSYPSANVLLGEMERCFAYEGIKQIGAIEKYECGIFERIYGWLDGLGVKYTVSPEVTGCMMHTDGKCYRDITVSFDK